MDSSTASATPSPHTRRWRIALWLARALVAVVFVVAGLATLWAPMDYLAAHIPWTRQFSVEFVRAIGVLDLAAGLGIALPLPARLGPGLTIAAALGGAAVQACALVLHLMRAEPQFVPLNVLLLMLCLFVVRATST